MPTQGFKEKERLWEYRREWRVFLSIDTERKWYRQCRKSGVIGWYK
jgi:hypothetical protein